MLGPLQQRLRDQSTESLRAAVLAARPRFEDALAQPQQGRPRDRAQLARRSSCPTRPRAACSSPTSRSPRPATRSRRPASSPTRRAGRRRARPSSPPSRTLNRQETVLDVRGDDLAIGVPLYRRRRRRRRGRRAAAADRGRQRRQRGPQRAAGRRGASACSSRSRSRSLLASTLLRRLGRLRAAALRISTEGPDVSMPRDTGHDEVGDLARALARMQEELRRQESARRAFVATASHELRTPLTMLQGTMELLAEDLDEIDPDIARRPAPGRHRAARAAAALDARRGAARPLAARRRGRAALRGGRARRARARRRGRVRPARRRARDRDRGRAARRPVLGPRRPGRGRPRGADPDRQRAALRRRRAASA